MRSQGVYKAAKDARGVNGMDEMVKEMSRRFARQSKSQKTTNKVQAEAKVE